MSEPAKIKNDDALQKRDLNEDGGEGPDNVGPYLRRWPGKVTQTRGQVTRNGYESGEWEVEITSKFLEHPVRANVNLDRGVGTQVQFHLDTSDATGKTAVTFFELVQPIDPRTNEPLGWEENHAWHKNRFPESDYEYEGRVISAVEYPS